MNAHILHGPVARDRARDDRSLARDLAQEVERTHKLAIDLVRALDHDLARDLATTLARIHDLVWEDLLAPDLSSRLARDLVFARALDLAGALVHDLDRGRLRDLGLTLARELEDRVRVLAHDAARVAKLMASIDWGPVQPTRLPTTMNISEVAQWITDFTARLLPAQHRVGKAEEFACELYDLADAGVPRRQQLGHALRVLAHVVPLHRELSRTHRATDGGS